MGSSVSARVQFPPKAGRFAALCDALSLVCKPGYAIYFFAKHKIQQCKWSRINMLFLFLFPRQNCD